jgi:hypothetical protein
MLVQVRLFRSVRDPTAPTIRIVVRSKETSLLYTGRVSYASLESVHCGAGGCHRVSLEVLLMLLRNFSLAYRTVWYTERMDPTRPVSRPGPGIDIVLDP